MTPLLEARDDLAIEVSAAEPHFVSRIDEWGAERGSHHARADHGDDCHRRQHAAGAAGGEGATRIGPG